MHHSNEKAPRTATVEIPVLHVVGSPSRKIESHAVPGRGIRRED